MNKLNKKVLIAEDDKDLISLLKESFESEGFEVVLAEDGEQGYDLAKKEKPDILLLDILMPKMNGIEMAKKLKGEGIKYPIIFLTNFGDTDHISSAIQIGESDYIVKSDMRIEDIILRVKARLEIK